jgi:GntR family transcriptional regulator
MVMPGRGTLAVPWVRLDFEAAVTVSVQLYRQIVAAIIEGRVASGSHLPSARSLAGELGLHYHTVNKVYVRLREEGFAVLNHRKEMVVRRPEVPAPEYWADWTDRQSDLLSEAMGHGAPRRELLQRLRQLLDDRGRPRRS